MSIPERGYLFRTYVLDSYEQAARAFAQDPSSNRWNDLKVAMWAWQHVHGMSMEEMANAADEYLRSVAIHAKGDANFGEPQ